MQPKHLPPWIRTRLPAAHALARVRKDTYSRGLPTVCREACCPNQAECFERGTATFLILGDRCTRSCTFCAVRHGPGQPVRPDEATRVAHAVASLRLDHAVITSVTRDDLEDGGAAVFASTIKAIRQTAPETTVEVLVPDFRGSERALQTVVEARPDVMNHNMETVSRLYPALRPAASYERSLALLKIAAELDPGIVTKSGIMMGVGETQREVLDLVRDLVTAGVTVLTVGQYLRPSPQHHPVARYVPPREFDEIAESARALGMRWVESGPLVRSSYRAGQVLRDLSLSEPICT